MPYTTTVLPTTSFPADFAPGAEHAAEHPAEFHLLRLPAELSARLERISRGQAEMLELVLAAVAIALLGRYTREDEVSVGLPNGLLLRAEPTGSLRELLGRVAATASEALTAGEVLTAGPGRVADVLVDHAAAPPAGPAGAGVRFTAFDENAALAVAVSYDSSRYAETSIGWIARQFELLLDAATAEPDRPVSEFPLSTTEDAAIIAASNATERDFDSAATIHGLFARQARATPDAPALLSSAGVLSYAALDARSNQLAHTLREHGVGPDVVVALLAERSVEMIVAILAVLKAGGAYLPVDPSYPPARISYLLSDSQAGLVLTQARFSDLASAAEQAPVLDLDDPASYRDDTGPVAGSGDAGDLAYVIYTSGSTGAPKGVLVEHRSVVNRLSWMQNAYPIGPGDVLLQKTSISFDVSVWELFWWSFTGAALALPDPGAEKDPALLTAAIERYRVTTAHFVPSMLTMFGVWAERAAASPRLASLRRVFASGEALTPGQAAQFARLLDGAELINLYGPTEATVDVSHQPTQELQGLARLPIGKPIDNIRLYVLDERGCQTPVGVPGELHIAGVGLARGYLNRPELTAERFVDGAEVGEQRLYRTGDLARWLPDGRLDYLGRVDLQVKVRGFRVEPGGIEERLRAHPAVSAAAVVAVDDGWQTSLRAFVVLREQASESALKQHLRQTLPEHEVPGRILVLPELPLLANGKLDRAFLAGPDALRVKANSHVEPRTPVEHVLAAIWREVLGKDRIGVHDNFFALGGNSIHFVPVLAKSRAAGLDFTFAQLFRSQTIAALAASIETTAADEQSDVAARGGFGPFELISAEDRAKLPADAEDAYPLSMLQSGLIFQTEITGGLGQYHDVLSYSISGSLDVAAFTEAVRLLTLRHPILRTTYHLTGYSEFLQVVHRQVRPPLSVADLRELDEQAQADWHERWLAAEKARRFDWEQGELVTLHVQILSDELYRYTVSQHNSALDGWSISLLHTQLFQLYYQLRESTQTDPGDLVPAVDNHLRNFVGLEREALRSTESRDFWLRVLDGAGSTNVPRRPGAVDTDDFRVVMRDVALPRGLTQRISELADSLSVPFKDVLLAAHVKVLGLVSGRPEVTTGYEHSGRPELPGAETTLGLHLNSLPFRIKLGEDGQEPAQSWADLIRQVYQAELDLLPHRRYPMAKMKQDLGTQRVLFDTTFNFTHFYLLKNLKLLPEFSLLEMRVDSETEFVFRTEFSRHFFDDELRLCLHYHSHLYDQAQIDRIGGYFVRVLELMADEPTAAHTARPLLASEDLALIASAESTAPVTAAPADEPSQAAAPSQSTIDTIAAVWARVLDLPAEEIGDSGDFFELGGNSLSALRVVLELDNLVSLTDLTRHPRLGELAGVADRRQRRRDELLHLLSPTAAGARCALICVPYPCGHPINFKPLADSVARLTDEVAVWGVELPGHGPASDGEFVDIAEAARRVVEEIGVLGGADLPVILWGHCGGAAITVELARLLEERGADLRQVFLGSKLLPPASEMQDNIDVLETWSDSQIISYMVTETGYTDLDGLDREHTEFMGRIFRHDVGGGYRYLIDAVQDGPAWKLATPVTVVVADDDPGLARAGEEYAGWRLLASDVRFCRMPAGGHYFVRTNPEGTADLILRAWAPSDLEA
ncbi:MAG TPA: amino acid adenylation domain-containing protein [Jatrophihabitans sp.]|jgi:amino acid adenylation domain-containing protein|uniref:amino acid adenylation domain-containing protein n=1 Tax=Jatrophihabitans sp. TaxID=1932789 RepID=UPI002EE95A7A